MTPAIELLAPAGGREALEAAVRCGADAVYLGGKELSARRSAQNFDACELKDAVSYCHMREVKVYLALNTLVTDGEEPVLLRAIRDAAAAGVDAVLVQDLGVLAALRASCPGLPAHASTQMVVHNLSSARMAARLGLARAVLARECSREEIAAITGACGIETEVFVHGALCMCVSGQCYLSAMFGGRSGNRGLCAQPCRLPFKGPQREFSLSLRDMTLVGQVAQLASLGVSSLKIEGRMKRPEYVAAAVTACREALEGRTVDFDELAAVFSRSGFTQSYYMAKPGPGLFGVRSREDVTAATTKLLSSYAALYRAERQRVPLDFSLVVEHGRPASLTLADDRGNRAAVEGDLPQPALQRPTDEALARRSLAKTGGTPFYLRSLSCRLGEGLMLPASSLNRLRQRAIARMEELRGKQERPWPCDAPPPPLPAPLPKPHKPALRLRMQRLSQMSDGLWESAGLVTLPLWELEAGDAWKEHLPKVSAELPAVLFPAAEERAATRLAALAEAGLAHVTVGGLGGLELAGGLGLVLHGDATLNVTNSRAALAFRELGLADLTLSMELTLRQAGNISRCLPMGLWAYGRLPLMTTRACPIRGNKGCGNCPGRGELTDRLGNRFPVDCLERRTARLLNTVPLYLGDRLEELCGFDFLTLYFTHESPKECRRVAGLFERGEPLGQKRTAGLYDRGVL